jgi:hypothetical protein
MPTTSYVRRLTRLAAAYRDAEARIAGAFFRKPRPARDHLRWLKAQAFKEHSAIRPLLEALAALYPRIAGAIERKEYAELAEKLADESRHAHLVMNLIERISGERVTPRDLIGLPEDRKLARIRARYSKAYAGLLHGSQKITLKEINRRNESLERAAITLTEGGGGAMYRACGKLGRRGGVEAAIASTFRKILADELEHQDGGARSLASLVAGRAAFDRAAEIINTVCAQRLRMRNEQFGFPLSADALEGLERQVRRRVDPRFRGRRSRAIKPAWR